MRIIVLILFAYAFSANAESDETTLRDLESVQVNGTTLSYIDTGELDSEFVRNPLLFVHGSLGDFRVWKFQIDAFSTDRRVIAYSRRYHYPNPWPKDQSIGFSPSVHADDLVAFIKTLGIEKLDLVGHSFGGVVALLVARDHGDLVSTVSVAEPALVSILGRPSHFQVVKDHGKKMIRPALKALRADKEEEMVRSFINGAHGKDVYSEMNNNRKTRLLDNAEELKGSLLDGSTIPPFTCVEARNMDIPTLLVEGDQSPEMYRLVIQQLENCLPKSSMVTLDDASHGLVYDNPAAFNNVLIEFLDRN